VDRQPRHLTPAFAVSVAAHAAVIIALLFLPSHRREQPAPSVTRLELPNLVWIPDPRPAARGGGGAPPKPTPPPPIPSPAVTTPPPAPIVTEPETIAPEPEPTPAAPAPSVATTAEPAGTQGNGGIGDKTGSGPGDRSGPGAGGDGVFPIGNGVTSPIPVRRPPPAYTAEAMRARLQGVVVLNCVVRPDGRCSDIRITKSLDMVFGLDQQAIASAREWVFRPGTRMGEPVAVLVTLEIGFTIR
jgi:periplasmic protein TonB